MDSRKIDALVAEKVMGWKLCGSPEQLMYMASDGPDYLPKFSTDISAAWQVVEKTGILNDNWVLYQDSGKWCISPYEREAYYAANYSADTAPMVICLAALDAVGVEVEASPAE